MKKVIRAVAFATEAHHGQKRKVSGKPFILHPLKVAEILIDAGADEELVAAGILHDVVEDTPYEMEDIEDNFGSTVTVYVKGNTEEKRLTWDERKQHTIDSIKHAILPVKMLIVADKLANLTELIENMETIQAQGKRVEDFFKRGLNEQAWYFKGVCENAFYGLKEEEIPAFFYTYKETVESFFK